MKRVCHVVQSYYLRDPRVRRQAEALAEGGYEVDVISLRQQGAPCRQKVNGVRIIGVPVARRRATAIRYLYEYAAFFFWASVILAFNLWKRYRVIHVSNMPDFLVFSTLIPKLLGAKVILDVHDPMAELFISKYGIDESSPVIRFIRWQLRISLRFCDQVLTVTDVMKDLIQASAGRTPILVVLNLPDENLFSRSEADRTARSLSEEFKLLYTGTVSARYGLGVAIEACALLINRLPALRMIVVGEGDDLPALRHTVQELGLDQIVRFVPPVPLSEVPKLIDECDVGVSPHVCDVFMQLYFSTKVAEFVNAGLPTIVSRTDTIEHYFDSQMVRYCEPGSVESFAEAVMELYEHPERRADLSRNSARFREQWNWATEKGRYVAAVSLLA